MKEKRRLNDCQRKGDFRIVPRRSRYTCIATILLTAGQVHARLSGTLQTQHDSGYQSTEAFPSGLRIRGHIDTHERHRGLVLEDETFIGEDVLDLEGDTTLGPTLSPSFLPTTEPSQSPSLKPTQTASSSPSVTPSLTASAPPSNLPSTTPSSEPSIQPSSIPSSTPSIPPSSEPSLLPSHTPSSLPSLTLSDEPSAEPSTQPSVRPSDAPSYLPSAAPSTEPSLLPSLNPSIQPSNSVQPSPEPSSKPSLSPSVSPSLSTRPSSEPSSSVAPSLVPSISPSDIPSTTPSLSITPSLVPSSEPSRSPSSEPSTSQEPSLSQVPSSSPSALPSAKPSALPSISPSLEPSFEPSFSPSRVPSASPSAAPSTTPSLTPSDSPTLAPSASPSSEPSSMPSSMPTNECHDNRFYTSPINGLNCEKHRDTACTDWRFVGLDLNQVAELVENCPVSCNIDCGTFDLIGSSFSFILSFVTEQMDANAQRELEETTQQYFQNFVSQREPAGTIELDTASLMSTDILSNRRLMAEEGGSSERELNFIAQLRVHLLFTGFVIDINTTDVFNLFTEAVDMESFTNELRRSDPYFSEAVASFVPPEIPSNLLDPANDDNGKSKSTATITVSVIGATCFVLGVGWLVYHGRRRSSAPCPFNGFRPKELPPPPGSPGEASLDIAPLSSAQTTPNATNGLLRMLSLSRSRSPDTTSSCSTGISFKSQSFQSLDASDDDSEHDSDGGSKEEVKHPLAGIIPPMIVIDIDDDKEGNSVSSCQSESKSVGSGVPMKHVEASSALMVALSTPTHAQMALQDILLSNSDERDTEHTKPSDPSPSKPSSDSDSFFSAASDDPDCSSASSLVTADFDMEPELRRTHSASALDTIEPSEALDVLIRSQWNDFSPTSSSRASSLPSSPDLGQRKSPFDISTPLNRAITMTPTRHSFAEAKTVRRGTHRAVHSGDASSLSSPFPPLLSNVSPIRRLSPQKKMATALPNLEFPGHSSPQTDEAGSISNSSIRSRASSKGASSKMEREHAERLSFEVPCSGKLGLIIESSSNRGPTVHTVKDYSPLSGLMGAGDRILRVDGEDTTNMSTGQVTRLLARRKTEGNSMLKIMVSRPSEIPPLPILVDSVETSPPHAMRVSRGRLKRGETIPPREGRNTPPKQQEEHDVVSLNNSYSTRYRSLTVPEKPADDEESGEGDAFHMLGANSSEDSYDDYY